MKYYRRQTQHIRKYRSGRWTCVNKGIYYKTESRQYRRPLISQILFHNASYNKKELQLKTVKELQEIWAKIEGEKYGHKKSFGSVYLAPDKREIFTYLDKRPEEVGGYIDFNKKGLENTIMFFGTKRKIPIPQADWEIGWHVHPKDTLPFPSSLDLRTFLEDKKQAELIFHQGAVTVVLHKKDKRLSKGRVDLLLNRWNRLLGSPKSTWNDFNNILHTLGFEMKVFSKGKQGIKIPITVVEPKKRTVWYK